MVKPTLLVLAAGMGSRYVGLKQLDRVGPTGEAILDYSVYDAHEAGFETVVIIIKEAIRKDFMETVGARLAKAPVEIRYAYQELDKLPEGYTVPADRTKPWGTGHAIACARDAVDGPFAVLNADDYYGTAAMKTIFDFLKANGTKTTAEIAVAVGESSPKTSAMCRQMVEENRLVASDVSVKGKGKQKAYTVIVE